VRKLAWPLGGVVVAALAAIIWWPEPVVPDGCPEGGCRVGYRFEDGGKAPEGWEPFETDDPVVALMDACLTYFMTGSVEQYPELSAQAGDGDVWVRLVTAVPLEQTRDPWSAVRISNSPYFGPYGTFRCDNEIAYDFDSWPEVLRWVNQRFGASQDWNNDAVPHTFEFDENWRWHLQSDSYGANVRVENQAMRGRVSDDLSSDEGTRRLMRFMLRTDYFGPYYEFVPAVPPIEF